MKFLAVDTLTGRVRGQLYPSKWEMADTLRSPGTGSLTIPVPRSEDGDPVETRTLLEQLREQVAPRRTWIAIEDDQGRFVAPPAVIPRRPARDGGTVVVSLVDWRAWFYRTPIRPNTDGTRRSYIRIGSNAVEQTKMIADLAQLGLDTVGAPRMIVDTPAPSGITRERTFQMLDRSIGEAIDSIQNAERGAEWWIYAARDVTNPRVILPHVATAYPERSSRTTPIRVEHRDGAGGNVMDHSWPDGDEAPTRVWAVGEGSPPDQVWAVDEMTELADGGDVAWEATIGPLDGVTRPDTAFEFALRSLDYGQALSGSPEFTLSDDVLPFGDVAAGDRARVLLDNGWDYVDVPAARIVNRVLAGGNKETTRQTLTIDIANADYGDTSTVPGEEVTDDGNS